MTLTPDGKRAIAVIWLLTPLSTIFLGLRLARKREFVGIDDWLLGFAVLLLYGQAITGTLCKDTTMLELKVSADFQYSVAAKGGEGKQMTELTANEFSWMLKVNKTNPIRLSPAHPSLPLIKFSVLVSYNGIFGRLKWFRNAVITLGALTAAWFLGTFFATIFQCTPIDKAWIPSKPGHCIPLKPYLYGNAVPNAIIDFCILLLPVAPVLRLQMATTQKVLVLLSFSLGSLACISSTVRAAQTRTVDITNLSASLFEASIWTYIEPNAGVLSACLPYLAHVFGKRLLDAFKTLSALMSRTTSKLGLLRWTNRSSLKTDIAKPGTQRAAYEAYDLSDNTHKGLPAYKNGAASEESVRHLV
ncbi:MAG: hypothetical protein Q9184_005543 [Pyrenodesmia sp. 2 TL-2023]